MKKVTKSVLFLVLIAGAFLAGSWYSHRGAIKRPGLSGIQLVRHTLSTHESHTPGNSPMALAQPMPAHVHFAPVEGGDDSARAALAGVRISQSKQQIIGVQVSSVEKAHGTRTLRLLGRVAADETRLYRINAGIDGAIREVSDITTGSRVKKNQLLATFSAPGALPSIQLFILNSNAADRAKLGPQDGQNALHLANANLRQRLDQLHSIGMSPQQMEEIAETKLFPESIKILAPTDGVVLARNVSPGLKFDKGAEFYRIADLRKVWILADVFENESVHVRPGARAEVSLPNQRTTFAAKVSEVLPQFDPATRTLKVRLEVDNPHDVLRPDMFVDVELAIKFSPTIAVPTDAVIDSGLKKTVFVERGAGLFEPREVETGWRFGERVEILKGLSVGERLVTSGTFLLDSESKMKLAARGAPGTASEVETTHSDAALPAHHHGHH